MEEKIKKKHLYDRGKKWFGPAGMRTLIGYCSFFWNKIFAANFFAAVLNFRAVAQLDMGNFIGRLRAD